MLPLVTKPLSWFKAIHQLRTFSDEADLRCLGESLLRKQLVPLPAQADGTLIDGQRRMLAARVVGLPMLQVIVCDRQLSDTEIRLIQLTENMHWVDLTAYEKYLACAELMCMNPFCQMKDLADALHIDPSIVARLLSPSRCIEPWQEALAAGKVGISDCYAASKLPGREQAELLALKLSGASWDTIEQAGRKRRNGTAMVVKIASYLTILWRAVSRSMLRLLRYRHIAPVGRTGSGKGVSIIIPKLLNDRQGSVVVFDPKGELFAATVERRRRGEHRIIRLDPFNVGRDALNPFDSLPMDCPLRIESARVLTESLVVRESMEQDPHWNDRAVQVITAVLELVLIRFRSQICDFDSIQTVVEARLTAALAMERTGVLSIVARHLSFFDSSIVVGSQAKSGFDSKELKIPVMALFLQIPPEQRESQKGLARRFVCSPVRTIGAARRARMSEEFFLFDEASALGSLRTVEDALVHDRSTGVRLFSAYSDGHPKEVKWDRCMTFAEGSMPSSGDGRYPLYHCAA